MSKVKVKAKAKKTSEQSLQEIENLVGVETGPAKNRSMSIVEELNDLSAILKHQQSQINSIIGQLATLNTNIQILEKRLNNLESNTYNPGS